MRRSFFSAMGAFATLPAVAGGFLIPVWTDEAFAADGSGGAQGTKLIIAKRYLNILKREQL